MNQANDDERDMTIGEVLTFGLATFGIISLGALVLSFHLATWLNVVLFIVGVCIYGYSVSYILACSKLRKEHGNES